MTDNARRVIRRMLTEAFDDPGDRTFTCIPSGERSPYRGGWFKGWLYDDGTVEWWPVSATGELHHADMEEPGKTGLLRLHWVPEESELLVDMPGPEDIEPVPSDDPRIRRAIDSVEDATGYADIHLYGMADGDWSGPVSAYLRRFQDTDAGVRGAIRARLGF